jgi:hypothetical protein
MNWVVGKPCPDVTCKSTLTPLCRLLRLLARDYTMNWVVGKTCPDVTCKSTLTPLRRMLRFKLKPNYYTWAPSRTKLQNELQYRIVSDVYRPCSWYIHWNRHDCNLSCLVAQSALVTDKHFLCSEMLLACQSMYCRLIRQFLVCIRIAKCFMNINNAKNSENERTFCLWMYYICTC